MRFQYVRTSVLVVSVVMSLGGCATGCLDKTKFTGNIANYSLAPDHKAVFMNTEGHLKMNWVYGYGSADAALGAARLACQAQAKTDGTDPFRCYPVAVDNKQTVFNPTSLYCGASPDTSTSDTTDFINALTNFNSSFKR